MSSIRELKRVGTEIYFKLTKSEYEEIMGDLGGNPRLLEPKIRFDKDSVVINQADIAMLIPSEFFTPPLRHQAIDTHFLLEKICPMFLSAVLFMIAYLFKNHHPLWPYVGGGLIFIAALLLVVPLSWVISQFKQYNHVNRTNYCKGKIMCLLYLNELNYLNEDTADLHQDKLVLIDELKTYRHMYDNLFSLSDDSVIIEHHNSDPNYRTRAPVVVSIHGNNKNPS